MYLLTKNGHFENAGTIRVFFSNLKHEAHNSYFIYLDFEAGKTDQVFWGKKLRKDLAYIWEIN